MNTTSTTSTPQLTNSFQHTQQLLSQEHSALEAESHHLQSTLSSLDKELFDYSFRQESARLLISRLLKERDDLAEKVSFFEELIAESKGKHDRLVGEVGDEEVEMIGMYEGLVERFKQRSVELFGLRKGRKVKSNGGSGKVSGNVSSDVFSSVDSSVVDISSVVNNSNTNNKTSKNGKIKIKSLLYRNILTNTTVNTTVKTESKETQTNSTYTSILIIILENSNTILLAEPSSLSKAIPWSPSNTRKSIRQASSFELNYTKQITSLDSPISKLGITVSSYCDVTVYDVSSVFVEKSCHNVRVVYQFRCGECYFVACFQLPVFDYCVVISDDYTWSVHSVVKKIQINNKTIEEESSSNNNTTTNHITSAALHPDGIYLALSDSTGKIFIISIPSEKITSTLDAHTSSVKAVCFAENGYSLASFAVGDSDVKVWDLRKSEITARLVRVGSGVCGVGFDGSGAWLGVGFEGGVGVFNNRSGKSLEEKERRVVCDGNCNGNGKESKESNDSKESNESKEGDCSSGNKGEGKDCKDIKDCNDKVSDFAFGFENKELFVARGSSVWCFISK